MIDPRKRRMMRRIRTAIAVFFALGVLIRFGLQAFAQEAPAVDEPAAAGTEVSDGSGEHEVGPGMTELPTVDEVMDYLNDLYRSDSSHATMTMEVVTENWSRTLEMESWSEGEDLALVVIRAPAREAGTASLKTADGLWNYAPRADRMMRVPSGMMSEGWMGSHFTNEDLMRESDYVDDYETTLAWGEEPDGARTIVATSVPLPSAAVVYSRVVYHMRADDWTPLRTEFFDGDELVRTFVQDQVEVIDGKPIPMRMEIVPHYAPGESTVVVYDELELNADVDSGLFTQRGLRRVAQGR